MDEGQFVAIEILTPEIASIVRAIKPELKELDFETELRYNFLALGFPHPGETTLVKPNIFTRSFEPIPGGERFILHSYARKIVNNDPLRKTYIQADG